MLQNIKKRNEGFTIIEVMIVLAIAGLIMLIVFLAVPALQRNSRNTQYKNDAASLLAAATEFSNNSQGKIPVSTDATAIKALANTKNITTLTVATNLTTATPNFTTAVITTGTKCGAYTSGTAYPLQNNVAARAMTIVYAVENSSGAVVPQCTES